MREREVSVLEREGEVGGFRGWVLFYGLCGVIEEFWVGEWNDFIWKLDDFSVENGLEGYVGVGKGVVNRGVKKFFRFLVWVF